MNITGKQVAIGAGVIALLYWILKPKKAGASGRSEESGGGGGGYGSGMVSAPIITVPQYVPTPAPTNVNVTLTGGSGSKPVGETVTSGSTATGGGTSGSGSGGAIMNVPLTSGSTAPNTSSPTQMGADGYYAVAGSNSGYVPFTTMDGYYNN